MAVHTVDVAGVAVSYREHGDADGPPVVLLHGGGSGAVTWDGFAAALAAAGYRAIAPTCAGTAPAVAHPPHGRARTTTGGVGGPPGYNTGIQADLRLAGSPSGPRLGSP